MLGSWPSTAVAPTPSAPAAPASTPPPQQYQNANTVDTNSTPNNAPQTQTNASTIPSTASGDTVWNLDWNDLVSCSFCNVAINVRILSPGDDGALTQVNDITSTSVTTVIDSLQQALEQQAIAPPPPAVPPPVAVSLPASIALPPLAALALPPMAAVAVAPPFASAPDVEAPPPAAPAAAVTDEPSPTAVNDRSLPVITVNGIPEASV